MKVATLFLLTSFATLLHSAEPEKLDRLRSSYEAAVTRATDPLRKTYLAELEKLKADFTRKAQLEEALAVDREIKKLASAGNAQPTSPPVEAPAAQPVPNAAGRAFERPMPAIKLKRQEEEKARAKIADLSGKSWANEEVSWLLQADGVAVRTFANGKVNRGWWELKDDLDGVSMRTADDYHLKFTSKTRCEAYPVGAAQAKGMKTYSLKLQE